MLDQIFPTSQTIMLGKVCVLWRWVGVIFLLPTCSATPKFLLAKGRGGGWLCTDSAADFDGHCGIVSSH